MIEIVGVTKNYATPPNRKGLLVLDNINLAVKGGEFVCVLGPSGCGKTTLIRSVVRLIPIDKGVIRIQGREDYKPGKDVCMVFQNFGLFPWLSLEDNVAFGLKLRGVSRGERLTKARETLHLVGLMGFEKFFPHQISGGMQQRVGLARALTNDPNVLLMDEPFAAVDAQTREILQAELVRVWKRTKKTIVFVTHSIDEAVYLGQRVVIMAKNPGRVFSVEEIDLPRDGDGDLEDIRALPKFNETLVHIRSVFREASASAP